MNWVITGGCGFIGTSLIKTLTKEILKSIKKLSKQPIKLYLKNSSIHSLKAILIKVNRLY